MKNITTNKRTGSLLLALLLMLMACDKQGPMGPEGPPGPDGANSGGDGGSSFTTYFVEKELEPHWHGIDGWANYLVYALNINGSDLMLLPDTAVSTINNGGLILVYLKIGAAWRSLPFKEGFHNGSGAYDYYFNYEVIDGKMAITVKVLDDTEVNLDDYTVERVKIVVAPASSTIPLKL